MAKETADNITGTDVLEAPQPVVAKKNVDTLSEKTQAPQTPRVNPPAKEVVRDSRIYLLSNDKRQGNVVMDFEEDVIDPATKKTRRMRLLRGAQSVWFDEQPPSVFPKEYVAKNVITKTFSKGKLIVAAHETLVIQAMALSNRNTGNPNRYGAKDIYFYEWNPVAENEKALKEQNTQIQAMRIAMDAPMEKVIPHIHYLNVQVTDIHGIPLDDGSMRTAYITYASTNPHKFLQSVDSPNVQIGYMIRKAIEKNTIDIGTHAGAAYWGDGGFITNIPVDKDPMEYLIEFANMYNDNATAFLGQLKTLSA